MSCGFFLRMHGLWVDLPGVKAGVQRATERASSSWSSVGGVRHTQSVRRATRSWPLDFGHAGPEAVAAVAVAAQGDGGETWLWDESSARANLLDPLAVRGRDSYPVVVCGTTPLRSLTAGSVITRKTETVALKANRTIRATGVDSIRPLVLAPDAAEVLVKVAVPPTPDGWQFLKAELVLTSNGQAVPSGAITAHTAPNSWAEGSGPSDYWTSVPAGPAVGYAPAGAPIELAGVAGFEGADMSLRLRQAGGAGSFYIDRSAYTNPAELRITYSSVGADRVFTQHLRRGAYTFGCWTSATAGTTVGKIAFDTGAGPAEIALTAPEGTGWRHMTYTFPVVDPLDVTFTIYDTASYLLGGLMLSTIPHPGVYLPGEKTPVRVRVEDPTLVLDMLLTGEHGRGPRTVNISEVGT